MLLKYGNSIIFQLPNKIVATINALFFYSQRDRNSSKNMHTTTITNLHHSHIIVMSAVVDTTSDSAMRRYAFAKGSTAS